MVIVALLLLLCLAARPVMACCLALTAAATASVPGVTSHQMVHGVEQPAELPPCHHSQPVQSLPQQASTQEPAKIQPALFACEGCGDCFSAGLSPAPLPQPESSASLDEDLGLPSTMVAQVAAPALLQPQATGPPPPLRLPAETPVTLKQRLLN